jgi:hypothetical protein
MLLKVASTDKSHYEENYTQFKIAKIGMKWFTFSRRQKVCSANSHAHIRKNILNNHLDDRKIELNARIHFLLLLTVVILFRGGFCLPQYDTNLLSNLYFKI